jgi:hypothetical protein
MISQKILHYLKLIKNYQFWLKQGFLGNFFMVSFDFFINFIMFFSFSFSFSFTFIIITMGEIDY